MTVRSGRPSARWGRADRATSAGWSPPHPLVDSDHLKVQAPLIALYAHLLPCISNITEQGLEAS